jgi:hypothetical protein
LNSSKRVPALLVSFVYLDGFLPMREELSYRDWALDSGAFSAHNSGTPVDLDSYIRVARELQDSDPSLAEVFALDDIGDWRASARNTEVMWEAGVEAIPTYHYGEPPEVLDRIAERYPKIALGGVARSLRGKKRAEWFSQCFARVWPKRVHGFGVFDQSLVMAFPFESCDATSWEINPCAFGNWRGYGSQRVSVRGSRQDLRVEVEYYLWLEGEMRRRWRREMLRAGGAGPTLRLALSGGRSSRGARVLRDVATWDEETPPTLRGAGS